MQGRRVFTRVKHRNNPKTTKKYRETHKKEIKLMNKKWRFANKKHIKEYAKKWYEKHSEQQRSYSIKWHKNNPKQVKINRKRNKAKRRKLGFVPLNKPFEGTVAHHIDKIFVIYIPKELHDSIRHNVWTGYNMKKINDLSIKRFLRK